MTTTARFLGIGRGFAKHPALKSRPIKAQKVMMPAATPASAVKPAIDRLAERITINHVRTTTVPRNGIDKTDELIVTLGSQRSLAYLKQSSASGAWMMLSVPPPVPYLSNDEFADAALSAARRALPDLFITPKNIPSVTTRGNR